MLICQVDFTSKVTSFLLWEEEEVVVVRGRASRKLNEREGKKAQSSRFRKAIRFSLFSLLSLLSLFILKMKKTMNSI